MTTLRAITIPHEAEPEVMLHYLKEKFGIVMRGAEVITLTEETAVVDPLGAIVTGKVDPHTHHRFVTDWGLMQ